MREERPWGFYEVLLDSEVCKVKRITVNPKQRLSLQYHEHRKENWTVVFGEADVTKGKWDLLENKTLHVGESITINPLELHRVTNNTDNVMVFIEVQTGEYFGEDDIVRVSDDYGRNTSSASNK